LVLPRSFGGHATLLSIASELGLDTLRMLAVNPELSASGALLSGTTVCLPADEECHYHEVNSGEFLFKIARQYNTSLEMLARLNPWITNLDLIHPGDRILLDVCGASSTGVELDAVNLELVELASALASRDAEIAVALRRFRRTLDDDETLQSAVSHFLTTSEGERAVREAEANSALFRELEMQQEGDRLEKCAAYRQGTMPQELAECFCDQRRPVLVCEALLKEALEARFGRGQGGGRARRLLSHAAEGLRAVLQQTTRAVAEHVGGAYPRRRLSLHSPAGSNRTGAGGGTGRRGGPDGAASRRRLGGDDKTCLDIKDLKSMKDLLSTFGSASIRPLGDGTANLETCLELSCSIPMWVGPLPCELTLGGSLCTAKLRLLGSAQGAGRPGLCLLPPGGEPGDCEEILAEEVGSLLAATKAAVGAKLCLSLKGMKASIGAVGAVLDEIQDLLDFLGISLCIGIEIEYLPLAGYLTVSGFVTVLNAKGQISYYHMLYDEHKDLLGICQGEGDCRDENQQHCMMAAGDDMGSLSVTFNWLFTKDRHSVSFGERNGCSAARTPARLKLALENTDHSRILVSELPDRSGWAPSTVYFWPDFLEALWYMAGTGVAGERVWLGDSSPEGWKYGMAAMAAFLAQSMSETIQFDACDENNYFLEGLEVQFSASNACGQVGQSYQDYTCPAGEEHMQCEVDPDMEIRGDTHAIWNGAPPQLFCMPRSKLPFSPRWDWEQPPNCEALGNLDYGLGFPDQYVDYIRSGEGCRDYPGQLQGRWTYEGCGSGCPNPPAPNFGRAARTDVEGCCWWGRGVIQTTGVCNFGKLNYYMGARAQSRGEAARFPDIDFCRDPQAICSSTRYPELKWIAGLFFWMNSVQSYKHEEWAYEDQLRAFVDGGMNSNSFIDGISGIVNRGCHSNCPTGPVLKMEQRRSNFYTVLQAMGFDVYVPGSPFL